MRLSARGASEQRNRIIDTSGSLRIAINSPELTIVVIDVCKSCIVENTDTKLGRTVQVTRRRISREVAAEVDGILILPEQVKGGWWTELVWFGSRKRDERE